MCGILGIGGESLAEDRAWSLLDTMSHRGPDAGGVWSGDRITLGHRRLAIVDLTENGRQPMVSSSGRYIITFNGEVYNFREIAKLLHLSQERSNSDTAVMLAAIEEWGLTRAVEMFRGMFAFGLWDTHARVLSIVRDRLGVKPLFFGWVNRRFIFASELKPFHEICDGNISLSTQSLADYFHYCCVPAPYSIYENIFKLLPGAVLEIQEKEFGSRPAWFSEHGGGDHYRRYWTAGQAAIAGLDSQFDGSFEDATQEFQRIFHESVGLRMIADVPLGAFLSGGIDSSLLVAVMQSQSTAPVRTFTIGSLDPAFDEAPYAEKVAMHLGTSHESLHVSEREAMEIVPYLSEIWDEPFSDSSQIPTTLVSRLTRHRVTVALSGDGGDELSLGYTRYATARDMWPALRMTPAAVRKLFSGTLQTLPLPVLKMFLPFHSGTGRGRRSLAERLDRFAAVFKADSTYEFCHLLMNHWRRNPLNNGKKARRAYSSLAEREYARFSISEGMSIFDFETYLADDLLAKVDRASMSVALEAREPFLDHKVVEFVLSLPEGYRASKGCSKRLLKSALRQYLPDELIDRPKAGFSIPLGAWLRGGLRTWAGDLLSNASLGASGLVDQRQITRLWQSHQKGEADHSLCLWDVLMFQSWYRRWMKS